MVWMVGVKGQPPPDSGSPWYHCFSPCTEKTFNFVLFIIHSVRLPGGSSIPPSFIRVPMSHQMNHWEQPDTICSDNSPVAARQGQLEDHSVAVVNCRTHSPGTFPVQVCNSVYEGRERKKIRRICTAFTLAAQSVLKVSHGNVTNNQQWWRHWFRFHSQVIISCCFV